MAGERKSFSAPIRHTWRSKRSSPCPDGGRQPWTSWLRELPRLELTQPAAIPGAADGDVRCSPPRPLQLS